MSWLRSSLIILALVAVPSAASAHITLTSPKPRTAEQKEGPCGEAGSKRGTNVTRFASGEKITVTWKETVPHPGHFRISFDAEGQSGFVDPKTATEMNSAPTVLVDDIADKTGTQTYSQEVTLPDVECENCTLQLIQLMTDKPPYGDGNDLYYQCADIALSRSATPAADAGSSSGSSGTPAPADDGGGCNVSSTSGVGEAALLTLATIAVLGAARRKRRRS